MSRAQVSGTSPSIAPQPKANLSHPCFDCGLMFANKDDYQHHEAVFHNARDKSTFMICDECGKTFENVDELGEHQLEHDLAIVVRALYETEATEAINRAQFKQNSSFGSPTKSHELKVKKNKKQKQYPQLIALLDGSSATDAHSKLTKKIKKEPPPKHSNVSADRRNDGPSPKKMKKEFKSKNSPSSTNVPKNLPQLTMFNDRSTSTDTLSKDATPSIFPTPSPMIASLQNPFVPSPTIMTTAARAPLTNPQRSLAGMNPAPVMLSSICPNCSENHGKPWSLIEHMIGQHGALLVRLEKKFTNDAKHTVSEIFSGLRCRYCSLETEQLSSCLSHIVRTHREKLFECSTFGECEVCFELMSTFGSDTTKRKFTIRVKIKRRAVNPPPTMRPV